MTTYSIEEVRALVEEYPIVQEYADTSRRGVRWMAYHVDIQKAYRSLSKPQREAILLHGFYGYGLETSAKLVGVSLTPMYRRYMRGLEAMVNYLNGVSS